MTETSTQVATREDGRIGAFNPRDERIVKYLGLTPGEPKSEAVVAVARRYGLDPVLKHVVIIPSGGVYITRDGLLHVAHESGQLDGIVVEQEPELSEDKSEWVARVTVYRKDMSHGFTFPGRYPVRGGNAKYAQEMALKAAESHALRRAFNVAGLPTLDEQRPDEQPQRRRVRAADIVDPPCEADPAPVDDEPVEGEFADEPDPRDVGADPLTGQGGED